VETSGYKTLSGQEEAILDLKAGKLGYRRQGLGSNPKLAALLKRKYDIDVKEYGCLLPPHVDKEGYNAVMVKAIFQRFGRNVIEEEDALFSFQSRSSDPLHQKGETDARRDLDAGELKLFYSSIFPWDSEVKAILKNEHGITPMAIEWMEDQGFHAYCHGYNSIMEAEIARRFGEKTLSNADAAARAAYRKSTAL